MFVVDDFPYSHHQFTTHYVDIVGRNRMFITFSEVSISFPSIYVLLPKFKLQIVVPQNSANTVDFSSLLSKAA